MYMPLRVLVMCGKSYGPAEQLQSKREFPGELVGEVSQGNVHKSERKAFAKFKTFWCHPPSSTSTDQHDHRDLVEVFYIRNL